MIGSTFGTVSFLAVFWIIGLGFVLMGLYLIRSGNRLRRTGARAHAEVVGMHIGQSSDVGGGSYYPVVRFRTADGQEIETSTAIGTSPSFVREGATVTVLYDPAQPRDVRIDSALGTGTCLGWGCVVGGGAVVVGVTLFVVSTF